MNTSTMTRTGAAPVTPKYDIVPNPKGSGFIVLKDGTPLQSVRFYDTRVFSTRAGARKAITRDKTGILG